MYVRRLAMCDSNVMTDSQKATIDAMTRFQMCSLWRRAPSGHPYLQGACGEYFSNRLFKELGGFTPEISKALSP